MTLILNLPPDVETALAADARRKGTTPERLVLHNLRQQYTIDSVPASENHVKNNGDNAMLALFAQWEVEDATDDREELVRRQREGDELMAALEANGRLSFEGRTDFSDLLDLDEELEGKNLFQRQSLT